MTTAYYILPELRASIHSGGGYLSADRRGVFAVAAGSADEQTLLSHGAIAVAEGAALDADTAAPTIKGSSGAALAGGDILKGGAASSGTPGSGTAVLGFMQIDSAGRAFPTQAATIAAPAYAKGALYFDTTLNKLMVGGATAWETVTSV